MTDHYDVPIVATGDWIDAAWINQYIGDNVRAWRQGFVTGGDMPYALDANTIAALNKPSVASLMSMDSLGVPSWFAKTSLPGLLHTKGVVFTNSLKTITSTTYVEVASTFKIDLVLTGTCTVFAWAHGMARKEAGSYSGYFALSINGVTDPNVENVRLTSSIDIPFSCMYYATGITAGTRTVKLMGRTDNAGDPLKQVSCVVHAIAIME